MSTIDIANKLWYETVMKIKLLHPDFINLEYDHIFDHLRYGYHDSKIEPHNTYHNFDHIIHCLQELRVTCEVCDIKDPLALELALWFHDVFYDIRCNCNEEMSSDIASDCLEGLIPDDMLVKVRELIRCTAYAECLTTPYIPQYVREEDDIDHLYIRDIDFSGFALTTPQVLDAGRRIRNESPWIPENFFLEKRCDFLSIIGHPDFRLFHTEYFNKRCERIAKNNIRKELTNIKVTLHPAPSMF